jgi:hypothetical protein
MKALLVVVSLLVSRTVFAEILDEKRLTQAVLTLPQVKLDQTTAAQLVSITTQAAEADLDPFVLLAQQYIESRFQPASTSRLIDGTRRTGICIVEPRGWTGNLYCGIAQNAATTWAACLALRETRAAIAAQTAELRDWLRMTKGDLPRALAGYGCGNLGAKTLRCNRYPRRVQAWARRLRRMTDVVPVS